MKKLFVNPEINTIEISQMDAIMVSANALVTTKTSISYSVSDTERAEADKLGYWAGKK